MIFLTVGTQFPFDRLLRAVDEAVERGLITDDVIAQAGKHSYQPVSFPAAVSISKEKFDEVMENCDAVISHAGMGNITAALENEKPLLVMPRRRKFGEVVNDHQVSIAEEFEKKGYLLAAKDSDQFYKQVAKLKSFKPRIRVSDAEGIKLRINYFINSISHKI